jgi:hypothetical protein
LGAHDVHDAREIVGQHVKCHLGSNPWQEVATNIIREVMSPLDRLDELLPRAYATATALRDVA